MIDPLLEEKAALAALGWSDDPAGLDRAAAQDSELAGAMRSFADVAAALTYDAALRAPPPELRARLFAALEPEDARVVAPDRARRPKSFAQLFRFPSFPGLPVMPYAVAACLMGLALLQAGLILLLDARLDALHARHDPLSGVELVDLVPQGDHGAAKVMVAWNAKTSTGMVSMDKMPDPPPGHSYQLWVIDPSKPTPVNAGVIPPGAVSRHFIAGAVQMPGRPGFAVSLENAGGTSGSTPGEILFAVAPSP